MGFFGHGFLRVNDNYMLEKNKSIALKREAKCFR